MKWIVAILALVSPLAAAAGPADRPPLRMCVVVGSLAFQESDPELKQVVDQLRAARLWYAREFQFDVVELELVRQDCPIRAVLSGYVRTALGLTVQIDFFFGGSTWGMKRVFAEQSPLETARNVIPFLEQFAWELRPITDRPLRRLSAPASPSSWRWPPTT